MERLEGGTPHPVWVEPFLGEGPPRCRGPTEWFDRGTSTAVFMCRDDRRSPAQTAFDLDDEGEQRILLTDSGIARSIDDISGLTTTNMTVGTVAYSAPEQLMGEQLDGRADQYALAATAYHLLTRLAGVRSRSVVNSPINPIVEPP
jgi:serine/threonine protein kinase